MSKYRLGPLKDEKEFELLVTVKVKILHLLLEVTKVTKLIHFIKFQN